MHCRHKTCFWIGPASSRWTARCQSYFRRDKVLTLEVRVQPRFLFFHFWTFELEMIPFCPNGKTWIWKNIPQHIQSDDSSNWQRLKTSKCLAVKQKWEKFFLQKTQRVPEAISTSVSSDLRFKCSGVFLEYDQWFNNLLRVCADKFVS